MHAGIHGKKSIKEQRRDIRPVRLLMAASRPASSPRDEERVINIANQNLASLRLLLEMTLQAERIVPFVQQSLVDRPMGRMADDTTLPHRFVLINKRTALGGMTLETGFVLTEESEAAFLERLLHVCPAALHCHADVRVVAIGATHFPFQHRMVMGQLKLRAHFQVALEASFR